MLNFTLKINSKDVIIWISAIFLLSKNRNGNSHYAMIYNPPHRCRILFLRSSSRQSSLDYCVISTRKFGANNLWSACIRTTDTKCPKYRKRGENSAMTQVYQSSRRPWSLFNNRKSTLARGPSFKKLSIVWMIVGLVVKFLGEAKAKLMCLLWVCNLDIRDVQNNFFRWLLW